MKLYNISKKIVLAAAAVAPVLLFSNCSKNSTVASLTPITTTNTVTTFAGSGNAGSSNGTGTVASFFYPEGVAVDASLNVYVADWGNNEIRKITSAGVVTTVAGLPIIAGGSTNSNATGAIPLFNGPSGIAVDGSGNLYVADYANKAIRKIVLSTGVVSTFASGFTGPTAIALDAAGNLYVADFAANLVRKVTSAGVVSTLAGSGTAGYFNGTGVLAMFNGPRGIAVDASANVYVADANNNVIREITPAGVVTTYAGTSGAGNISMTSTTSNFYYPSGLAIDAAGNLYVADADNNLVRKITPAGVVTAMGGSGYLLIPTPFNAPVGVAVDANGVVYVANEYGNLIQKVQ